MSIVLDATSSGTNSSTSLTVSHTCTGTNLVLVVSASNIGNGGGNTLSCTYNGVSMTKIFPGNISNCSVAAFYLLAPTTGANNIVLSSSGGGQLSLAAASYIGVNQTGQPNSSASVTNDNQSSTSLTATNTTIANNCWSILCASAQNGGLTASTGATLRAVNTNSGIFDSNGGKIPAGSVSESITFNAARNAGVLVAFSPFINNYTRSLSDSISYGASRTVTLSRVASYVRSLSDSIMNGASRFAYFGKVMSRSLSYSMMNAVSRFVKLTTVNPLHNIWTKYSPNVTAWYKKITGN